MRESEKTFFLRFTLIRDGLRPSASVFPVMARPLLTGPCRAGRCNVGNEQTERQLCSATALFQRRQRGK